MAAIGWAQMNSRNSKIMLATIYIFMSLFYIVVSHTSAIRLIREEGQRLPILAMQEMNIQKNDKILFLYYPKQRFEKYAEVFDLTTFLQRKDWAAFMHYIIKSRNIDVVMESNSYYGYYAIPFVKSKAITS